MNNLSYTVQPIKFRFGKEILTGKMIPLVVVWMSGSNLFGVQIDLNQQGVNSEQISHVESVWVDNSKCASSITITTQFPSFQYIVQAGFQGSYPLMVSGPQIITASYNNAAALTTSSVTFFAFRDYTPSSNNYNGGTLGASSVSDYVLESVVGNDTASNPSLRVINENYDTNALALLQSSATALGGTLVVKPGSLTLSTTIVSLVAGAAGVTLLNPNPNRRFLRVTGSTITDTFNLGFNASASATSSGLYGQGGVLGYEQFGVGDGCPTGTISGYSAAGCSIYVVEGV